MLSKFWQSISTRERGFLIIGCGAVLIILLYAFVWVPWHDALKRLRQEVPAQRETLAWMQREAKQIKPLLNKRTKNSNDVPLLTVIEQSARSAKLRDAIREMQPGENGEVKVWLRDTYFDSWLRWIDQLSTKGITITTVSVSKSQEANKVNIRMTAYRTQ